MNTHTRFTRYTASGEILGEANDPVTGDGEVSFNGQIAPSATQEIDLSFLFANLKSFCAALSGGALTLKTNSSTVPDDELELPAGVTAWNVNDLAANPFTANVTKLFLVNASGTATVNLKLAFLLDTTP